MKTGKNILILTALVVTSSILTASPARADEYGTIDRTDQIAVSNAYLHTYLPTLDVPIGWTGDTAKCLNTQPQSQPVAAAGAPSPSAQRATFTAVNYFRDMAGLAPVTESAAASALGQQAALIMFANGSLSHSPDNTSACWSQDGYDGARSSNLSLGWGVQNGGARAVTGQMSDSGSGNTMVGHRRWILYPPTSSMGSGSTNFSNSLVVFGSTVAKNNPSPAGVGWPSAGYFPYQLLPDSQRWSYSANDSGMGNAQVSVKKNGSAIAVNVINADTAGYGWPTVAWELNASKPAVGAVDHYLVSISGINNPVSYTVDIYSIPEVTVDAVSILGYRVVGATVQAEATTSPGATVSYEWTTNTELSYTGGTVIGTGDSIRIPASEVGKYLYVKALGTQDGAKPAESYSPMYTISEGDLSANLKLVGAAEVGGSLTASVAGLPAGARVQYEWFRGSKQVTTGSKYVLTQADAGATVKVTAEIKAAGYHSATLSASKAIRIPITGATVSDMVWTGKQIKSGFSVKVGSQTLKSGTDFTVAKYGPNIAIGKGTVNAVGIGKYSGSKTLSFKILPKAVKVTKLAPAKGAMKVTWAKASAAQKVTGYQLNYRIKGSSKITTKQVTGTTVKLTKLSRGKAYQFRIRACKKVGQTNYCSAWSAWKTSAKVK
jgi:uncharacterized protein YkwD